MKPQYVNVNTAEKAEKLQAAMLTSYKHLKAWA